MALYLAEFEDTNECLLEATTPEEAIKRLADWTEEEPIRLHLLPSNVLLCEVVWAEPEPGPENPMNAANLTDEQIAMVPGPELGEWLIEYLETREGLPFEEELAP